MTLLTDAVQRWLDRRHSSTWGQAMSREAAVPAIAQLWLEIEAELYSPTPEGPDTGSGTPELRAKGERLLADLRTRHYEPLQ